MSHHPPPHTLRNILDVESILGGDKIIFCSATLPNDIYENLMDPEDLYEYMLKLIVSSLVFSISAVAWRGVDSLLSFFGKDVQSCLA